jgi:uncharacterized protein (DUF1684 family)
MERAPLVTATPVFAAQEALELLAWKRQIFALYAEVRAEPSAVHAWRRWRDVRDRLYRDHPQSPLPEHARAGYRSDTFDYDPAFRVVADVVEAAPEPSPASASTGGTFDFTRVGLARFDLLGAEYELELLWNEGYGGGILVAVADTTSGEETYGGGRYVLDTVKGADLGGRDDGLVLDFNFAYNPSCAFDARWSCPLAPPANRLPMRLEAGEKAPRT